MGMAKVYAYAVAAVFAIAMAAAMWSPYLQNTALERWASNYASQAQLNATAYQYQPPAGITTFIGDFVWGLAKTLQLFGSTPQMVADLLSAWGVPDAWARLITFAVSFALVAYIIYMVSGRLFTTQY
jgi:hypothetical protein